MEKTTNFEVYLYVMYKNGKPTIELRKNTGKEIEIKEILDSAFNNVPIIVFPVFRNKVKAVCNLIEHGILEYDSSEKSYSYII